MKKLLSLIMVVLIGFLNCGVSGYEVEYFPDGGKTITYTYEELSQLSEKHKQLLEEIINDINIKRKRYTNIKIVSSVSSVLCIVAGIFMCVDKGNKLIPGIVLGILGALSLIGVPVGLNHSMDNLEEQMFTVEGKISEFNSIKRMVDRYILSRLSTVENITQNFYYTLFVDKDGFVYQVRWDDAYAYHHVTRLLETKYWIGKDW